MKLSAWSWLFTSALVTTGCATSVEPEDPGDPAAPVDDGAGAVPKDGTRGKMKIRRGGRVREVTYTVRHGHAFYQNDLDLGPAPRTGVRSIAIRDLDARWPNNTIDFRFDGALFTSTTKTEIRAAMAEISRLTPIKFREGVQAGHPYISYQDSTDFLVSYTTGLGPDGTAAGDETDVNIWSTHNRGVVMHELGHAFGLDHEQSRSDRDQFVTFYPGCSTDDSQFSIDSDDSYDRMTYYDLKSIMHYASNTFCEPGPGPMNCLCLPLVEKGGDPLNGTTGVIPGNAKLSPSDVRSITRMYEPTLSMNVNGDRYGHAIATGDFNADGFVDLAIGVPGKSSLAGAVDMYMGSEVGLVAWKVLTSPFASTGADNFGSALTAADLNDDGFDDLVVGAPGRNGAGSAFAAGAFFVFNGSDAGPVSGNMLMQGMTNGGGTDGFGDNFGAALATGDFDHDGRPELVVGAPGKAISGGIRAGAVMIYRRSTASSPLTLWRSTGEPGTQLTADHFGQALAVGDLDDDGVDDLVVGAPAFNKPGMAFLFPDVSTTMTYNYAIVEASTGADAPSNNDQFGAALAVGNFDRAKVPGTTRLVKELAVGAPNKGNPTGSGRVFVFRPHWDLNWGLYVGLVQAKYFGQATVPGQTNLAGDAFGSSLEAADLDHDGFDDLVVGVPKKDVGTKVDAGGAEIFRGTTGTVLAGHSLLAQSPLSSTSAGDKFGTSAIVGDFNSDGVAELVVGVPNHLNSWLPPFNGMTAGAVNVYLGLPSAMPFPVASFFDQTVASPE